MNVSDRFTADCLPILVVDASGETARQLTTQLQHSGVQVDVATSDPVAYVAAHARHYGSLVVVVDPNQEADLKFLASFRNKVPRTWLIAISSAPHPRTKEVLRLFDGSYDRPFIIDNRLWRFLHFDLDCVQSAMSWRNPYALSLAYTRKMMAFLLFNSAPRRILLLGLGGGSLAKFCHRRLPSTAVTAVEVNPDVIALREAFCIPSDNDRFRVIRADGAGYVTGLRLYKDVILADACDRTGIAPQFDAFDDQCMTLPVRSEGNVIVFAFKGRRPEIDWERFTALAADLKRRFGLDFPRREVAQMAAQPNPNF